MAVAVADTGAGMDVEPVVTDTVWTWMRGAWVRARLWLPRLRWWRLRWWRLRRLLSMDCRVRVCYAEAVLPASPLDDRSENDCL